MVNYEDLELSVLSCLLQKPDLMEKVILKDAHFKKHMKLWKFMQAFYNKFHTFDLVLMVNISKNKYRIGEYISWLIDLEPCVSLFELYQQQLIDTYNETQREKFIKNKIFEMTNELMVGQYNTKTFKDKIEELYKQAERIQE